MQCIGILAHPLRPRTFPVVQEIEDKLRTKTPDMRIWSYERWQEQDVIQDVQKADLVIAIGGDGAMLRAARVCAQYSVAVLGVNMGYLGFLTEIVNPENWESQLDAVLADDYWVEKRSLIHATILRNKKVVAEGEALNDIVVSGGAVGRMIQVDIYIDGDWATSTHADALVTATATGSTAYALACGGPILPPELNNILVIPAAPHLSMDRPIVLSEGAQVDILAQTTGNGEVVVSADGVRLCNVEPDDRIHIEVSDHEARFVRLRGRNYFYRSLLDRLEPRIQRLHARAKRLE